MKAAETSVIVRAIARDDEVLTRIAIAAIGRGVFIPDTVLMETEWVLRSRYRFTREEIADAFTELLDSPGVNVASTAALRWAIDRHRVGADFADLIHIIASRDHDALLTFDRAMPRDAGERSPMTIEVLR